jgi:hypothetical protein
MDFLLNYLPGGLLLIPAIIYDEKVSEKPGYSFRLGIIGTTFVILNESKESQPLEKSRFSAALRMTSCRNWGFAIACNDRKPLHDGSVAVSDRHTGGHGGPPHLRF